MTKTQRYWFCQIAGWSIFFVVQYIVGFAALRPYPERLSFIAILLIAEILLTHACGLVIIRYNWQAGSITKYLALIISASILLSVIINAVTLAWGFVNGLLPKEYYELLNILRMFVSLMVLNLAWLTIYSAVLYFENYRRAVLDKVEYDAVMKDFELKKLKSQLNPHFIFNILNNIRALVKENPELAQKTITQLANILRYSLLLDKRELVTLKEEIQIAIDYLELEAIRLEERLKVTIKISPKSLAFRVPPMMVQTLCENAVKHGIAKLTKGGSLLLETMEESGIITIRIVNDGTLLADSTDTGERLGIKNTRHRLKLIYGDRASFEIRNIPGDKVLTEITIQE
jgi:sensor histidine kinase YesM